MCVRLKKDVNHRGTENTEEGPERRAGLPSSHSVSVSVCLCASVVNPLLFLPRAVLVQPVELLGAVPPELLLAVGGLVGVLGQVALQLPAAVLVAALLHRPLQLAHLPLVGVGRHITPRRWPASSSPPTPGTRRSTASSAPSTPPPAPCVPVGHEVEVVEPSAFRQVARAVLPGDPARAAVAGARLRPGPAVPAGPRPRLHGGAARATGSPVSAGSAGGSSAHRTTPGSPSTCSELARVPEGLTYRLLRWFHNRSASLMVATPSLEAELKARGFTAPMRRWSRGVDLSQFRPRPKGDVAVPAAGAAVRRPGVGREGDRGLPAAEDGRDEARRRRRPGAGGAGEALPGRGVPRLPQGRGAGRGATRRRTCSSSRAGRTRSGSC